MKKSLKITKLDKNKKYLLGCSFGPDSMALFSLLKKEGYNFEVAIVNYHLRKESNDEVKGLTDYCYKLCIPLYVLDVDMNKYKGNIEENCRNIRYEWFAKLVKKRNLYATLIAHNQDDLLETYIIQKRRQNLVNFYGLSYQITLNNSLVLRPLLNYTKQELLEYCNSNNIPYMIDSSNNKDMYLRNRIRHNVVMKMSEEERKLLMNEISCKNKDIQKITNKISKINLEETSSYKNLNEVELCYAVNQFFKENGREKGVSKKQCLEIRKVIFSKKSNIILPIDSSLIFVKSYKKIQLMRDDKISFEYLIECPCKLDTPYFYLDFTKGAENRNVTSYPFIIRNPMQGDKYRIKGYYKTLKRLFIDWKMPIILRKRWPIFVNMDGFIFYVPRYRSDFIIDKKINFYVK